MKQTIISIIGWIVLIIISGFWGWLIWWLWGSTVATYIIAFIGGGVLGLLWAIIEDKLNKQ